MFEFKLTLKGKKMKILIKNGRILNPATNMDEIADLLIEDGKVKAIAKEIEADADKVIDAAEKFVMPGLSICMCISVIRVLRIRKTLSQVWLRLLTADLHPYLLCQIQNRQQIMQK